MKEASVTAFQAQPGQYLLLAYEQYGGISFERDQSSRGVCLYSVASFAQ